jgi:hypothetical protein
MSVISSVYTSNVRSAVYTSKTLNIVDSDCKDRNSFGVKAGVFKLNGKEVIVEKGETLESLSKKINKHLSTTGIKATIVEKDNGYKLQLISSNNKPVQIFDPKGVLKNLYDKNHIGNSSKHLIQVIGGELYYNKALPSQSSIKPLLKLNKQYSPEPNLFVENTLVNLNQVQFNSQADTQITVQNQDQQITVQNQDQQITGQGQLDTTVVNQHNQQQTSWSVSVVANYLGSFVSQGNNLLRYYNIL